MIGALALALFSWGTWQTWFETAVRQPIQFPHKTHVEQNLQCTSCHEGADRDISAGRPATELCLSCHGTGDATPEITKVQAYEKGGEIPWRRVWRLPSHVFFSHRTHVAVAKVACQTCHGPMETLDRPPARALKALTMKDCIGCHQQWQRSPARTAADGTRRVSTDCATCHR